MAQSTDFSNINLYPWIDASQAPENGLSQSQQYLIDEWKRTGNTTNLNYYTNMGPGHREAITDWVIQQTQPIAEELGISASQLLTNPQLYSDSEALKKYTGVQPEEEPQRVLGGLTEEKPVTDDAKLKAIEKQLASMSGSVEDINQQIQTEGLTVNGKTYKLDTDSNQWYEAPEGIPGGEGGDQISFESTGNEQLDAILDNLTGILDRLVAQGKIDPSVEITPEKAAEFLAQAQEEISPYYQTQLALARESLLREMGYARDEILRKEQEWQQQYGEGLETLGETLAEKGMAYSGKRLEEEQQLAEDYQKAIEDQRRQAQFAAGTAAREFSQLYGTESLEPSQYTAAPTVVAGQPTFTPSSRKVPFYQLSEDVYGDLVGEKQYEQTAEEKRRAAELEGAYRQSEEAKKLREISL